MLLAETEKTFIFRSVLEDVRIDGRSRMDYRSVDMQIGVLPSANGSCMLQLNGESTRVLVAVKLSVMEEDESEEGDFFVSDALELYDGRIKSYIEFSGMPRTNMEQRMMDEVKIEYGMLMDRILNQKGVVDFQKLSIIPGKLSWSISIDVTVINFGGNLMDTIFLATRAALYDVRIPVLAVEGTEYSIDESLKEERFVIDDVPVTVTLTKVGSNFIVDARAEEEGCADARLTVAVDKNNQILAIQKGLSRGIPSALFTDMIQSAKSTAIQLIKQQEALLASIGK